MHKWYVVQVISSHEKKVKRIIEENREKSGMGGFVEDVLIPTENVSEVKSGQQRIMEKRFGRVTF